MSVVLARRSAERKDVPVEEKAICVLRNTIPASLMPTGVNSTWSQVSLHKFNVTTNNKSIPTTFSKSLHSTFASVSSAFSFFLRYFVQLPRISSEYLESPIILRNFIHVPNLLLDVGDSIRSLSFSIESTITYIHYTFTVTYTR